MLEHIERFIHEALVIWTSGGWAMVALALNALVIFGVGMSIFTRLRAKGFRRVPERTWRLWLSHPLEREGPIGEVLNFVTTGKSVKETARLFAEVRVTESAPFLRDLRLMRISVSAAPLLGLLGTVTGMLTTFRALATGAGGDETMAKIAGGISEALITTETGLVIALVGLFFQYQLARTTDRYQAFLAHLETVCMQRLVKSQRRKRSVAA